VIERHLVELEQMAIELPTEPITILAFREITEASMMSEQLIEVEVLTEIALSYPEKGE